MANLATSGSRINLPAIIATTGSIDTVELFVRRVPRGFSAALNKLFGRRIDVKEVRDRTNYFRGLRVPINRPTARDIAIMRRLLDDRNLGATVSRVDIAIDFTMENSEAADSLVNWLDRHVVLKWRSRKGKKRRWSEDERYRDDDPEWIIWSGKHAPRDLAVYGKTDSIVRLELRFQKPEAVKRMGLDRLENLGDISQPEHQSRDSLRTPYQPDRPESDQRGNDPASPKTKRPACLRQGRQVADKAVITEAATR